MRRLLRSALYVPLDKPRAVAKARGLACDAAILDLEDAVAPGAKDAARDALAEAAGGWGDRLVLLRVNGRGTPWHEGDMAAARAAGTTVLLPKVDGPEDVPPGAWAMIETPAGVVRAAGVAARAAGLVVGTNDLARALGAREAPGRLPLLHALQAAVLAARAAGVPALDGVWTALDDPDGLRAEAEQGRAWGFNGKTVIHPAQVDVVNTAFSPTRAEVAEAGALVAAWEAAGGAGVAVHAGRMIEALHVDTARGVLAHSAAIRARSGREGG